jgi:hypothetical protein
MKRLLHRLSFLLHAVFGGLEALPFCMEHARYAERPCVACDTRHSLICTKRRGHLGEHAE